MANQPVKAITIQELQEEIKRLEDLLQEKTDRLQEAQETLDAIRSGAVDGLVRSTAQGDQIFLLKGSDQPYRNLIEEMNEGALLLSETGTILYCNDGFARLVDAPLEGIMGSNIRDWVHPNSILIFDVFSSNPVTEKRVFETTLKTTKQKPIATLVSVNKISIDSINALALIVTDLTNHMEEEVRRYTVNLEKEITERGRVEEALRESEGRYRSLFNSIDEGFCIIEMVFDFTCKPTDYRILEVNYMYEKQTGIHNPVGKLIRSIVPDLEEYWFTIYGEIALSGKPKRFENESKAMNHYYDVYAFPIGEKRPYRLGVLFKDIAERKKAEDELKQAQAKLQEHANNLEGLVEERTKKLQDAQRLAAIGQVAGMVGHDIRNPLQAIVGELYFAKESMKELPTVPKEAIESLEFIQEQTDYISKIVSDLQDYAKPLKPDFSTVELCEFISGAIKTIVIPANIQTAFNCEKQMPQIKLDKTFTTRVLTNLVNNAVQAMPQGGKLAINASKQNNTVVITVEDTGVGIPEDVKPKLFTPLFTTKSKGQGFGLPVVKRLVEAQGGSISFESEVGKGTKFIVTLPLTR